MFLPEKFYATPLKRLISVKICRQLFQQNVKDTTSTAFIKKALYENVTPIFTKVKGQFLNENVKLNAGKDVMKSFLNKHFHDIRDLRLEHNAVKDKLEEEIGPIFTGKILKSIIRPLQRERLESFRTNNRKLFNLMKKEQNKMLVIKYLL